MEHTSEKQICIRLLAHVDAGKTTLSEALLYQSGAIRTQGRVDNRDAFLDTNEMERERGITIFSKQAVFAVGDTDFTILDTPGHVDFSSEMERTLQILDYAILVISGVDGVQGHTRTLWRLLKKYRIPIFLFVNKMDREGTDRAALMENLRKTLSDACVEFSSDRKETASEETALCGEEAMEQFLDRGSIDPELLRELIAKRQLFPCYFGSALKLEGIDTFLSGLQEYTKGRDYGTEFGARVFKISRDEQGNRLTWLRVTGGTLPVRSILRGSAGGAQWEEKVNQIRLYSGSKYEAVSESRAGEVCAVTGLTQTYAGEGFGVEQEGELPLLSPVLTYELILPEGVDAAQMLPKCRLLEEEDPQLQILWEEEHRTIQLHLMGEVQTEILKRMIRERFGVEVSFGPGRIVYKETIAEAVEGVGHFEPLRHYAEVHLLLEPGEPGSGVELKADCSEDVLSRNWQRLILTHLAERTHRGVLTGAALTDVKITLVSGRAHRKHTEGGDFRQATYRAVRQGLMKAKSILLEPFYRFCLEVPADMIGRAMTDMKQRDGQLDAPLTEGDMAVLTGTVPAAAVQEYQKELHAYTKGRGRLALVLQGYEPCHNQEELVAASGYEPEHDEKNTADSVFCIQGESRIVPWYEVESHMHLPGYFADSGSVGEQSARLPAVPSDKTEEWIGTEEIDAILDRTYGANRRDKGSMRKAQGHRDAAQEAAVKRVYRGQELPKDEYLLVDGYNVIFAWEELKALAEESLAAARDRLMDILCDYQGIRGCELIVVFDAYRVEGQRTEVFDYHRIHVVYTKEAETADQYIEKFAHDNAKKYRITVATSDGLEQIIIRGVGCGLMSSRELEEEIKCARQQLQQQYREENRRKQGEKRYLLSGEELLQVQKKLETDPAER